MQGRPSNRRRTTSCARTLGLRWGSVKHSCDVVYNSAHDPNPADYNDSTWLDVVLQHRWQTNRRPRAHGISRLGTPWRVQLPELHARVLVTTPNTSNLSNDGGYHYKSFPAPANYMVGLPFKYVVNDGPEGYSVDTNNRRSPGLVLRDGHRRGNWPPNCTGQPDTSVWCLWRVAHPHVQSARCNLLARLEWHRLFRFVRRSVSRAGAAPRRSRLHPGPYYVYVNALNVYEPTGLFVATLWIRGTTPDGPEVSIFLSSTRDFGLLDAAPH